MSDLVDACRAWCALTGEQPILGTAKDAWWLKMAIRDFGGEFSKLNGSQRRMIAGVNYVVAEE